VPGTYDAVVDYGNLQELHTYRRTCPDANCKAIHFLATDHGAVVVYLCERCVFR